MNDELITHVRVSNAPSGLEISLSFKEGEGVWKRGEFLLPWEDILERVKENSHEMECSTN